MQKPTSRHYVESLHLKSALNSSPQSSGNPLEEEPEGIEDIRGTRPSDSTKQATSEYTETETACKRPAEVCNMSSAYVL